MLTRAPRDWRIIDGNTGSVVRQSSQFGIQGPQLAHRTILPLSRMQDGQVVVDVEETSHDTVKEKEANTDPDPMFDLGRDMQIDEANEDGE